MKRIILTVLIGILLCPVSPAMADDVTALPAAQRAEGGVPTVTPPAPSSRKGLMIAGWAIFGGTYIVSALVGLEMMAGGDDDPMTKCLNCHIGKYFLIPVVGPFLAIEDADGMDGRVVAGVMGAIQVIGLGLAIPGTIMFTNDRKEYKAWQRRYGFGTQWYVTPAMTGGHLQAPGLQAGFTF